jgi:hypothetical protein
MMLNLRLGIPVTISLAPSSLSPNISFHGSMEGSSLLVDNLTAVFGNGVLATLIAN